MCLSFLCYLHNMTHLAMSPWMAKRKPTTFTGKKVKRGCKGACKSSKRMIANSYYKRQALAKFGMFDACLDWKNMSCQFTIFHLYHPVPSCTYSAVACMVWALLEANRCKRMRLEELLILFAALGGILGTRLVKTSWLRVHSAIHCVYCVWIYHILSLYI